MITVYEIKLDFRMENLHFVRELYGRWGTFCRVGVEEIIEEVFIRYDLEDEVIQVERLEVNLGVLPETEFYECFPKLLKDKLSETFSDLLRHAEGRLVNIVSLHRDGLQILLYFLMYGSLPPTVPEEYRELGKLLTTVVDKNGRELGREFRRYGGKTEFRRRLVMQFRDQELEKVVEVINPSESLFIRVYTRGLIASWPRLSYPDIAFGDYRNVVWEVVWAYLLCEGRDFFSRKQLVRQTIASLALRFNLKFLYLLVLLTTGLRKMISGWLIMPELSVILSEIRREETEKVHGNIEVLQITSEEGNSGQAEDLRKILSQPDSCRHLLQSMQEEDICHLVEIIIPRESPFVISYARKLEQDREKGILEGRAGGEFRVLKWEFIFLVLLAVPMSAFDRTRLVVEVLRHLAAHYNMDPRTLLVFLCSDLKGLPPELQQILRQLYGEQTTESVFEMVEALEYRGITEQEIGNLRFVLSHPQMGRRLLQSVTEPAIYRIVRILIPAESSFVISYARTLDREKEKGMLEGKAGNEFQVLKWELIFIVVVNSPASPFNRKQFVYSVLGQIAAHYNLDIADVAIYFYRALCVRKSDFTRGVFEALEEWIRNWKGNEMWEQNRNTERKEEEETGLKAELEELIKQTEVTLEVLREAGIGKVEELLIGYRRKEMADFIREHREVLWKFMKLSAAYVRRLYHRMQVVEGLGDFLVNVFGRKAVAEVLHQAGIWLPDPGKLPELAWQEAFIRKDAAMIRELLNYSPVFLRHKRDLMSLSEKRELEEFMKLHPDLLQQWLVCVGSPALRQAMEEVLRLQKRVMPEADKGEWLMGLLHFTYRGIPDFSVAEILRRYWDRVVELWSAVQRIEIYRALKKQVYPLPLWESILEENTKMEEAVRLVRQEEKIEAEELQKHIDRGKHEDEHRSGNEKTSTYGEGITPVGKQKTDYGRVIWKPLIPQREKTSFYINNAGMVILAPYFIRLFDLMKLTRDGAFTDEKSRVRAVFAMQYLVFGQVECPETELMLNKLLVHWQSEEPLPLCVEFTEEEKEMLDSLLKGVMGNWGVMKSTSVEGFRGSFLIRNGMMVETPDFWQLTVEEKSYDMLLSTLPWSISPVKFPWMEKALYVNWR